jgi:Protein of unknown function (DUF3572)
MLKSAQRGHSVDREMAETIAAQGLAFLTADPHRLQRFLALTGIAVGDLKGRIGAGEVLVAALTFLAQDESLLLTFAASHRVAPETIGAALARLDVADGP